MRFLIQRVNHASVTVDDKEVGKIGKGLLVFVGVFEEDTEREEYCYGKRRFRCGYESGSV